MQLGTGFVIKAKDRALKEPNEAQDRITKTVMVFPYEYYNTEKDATSSNGEVSQNGTLKGSCRGKHAVEFRTKWIIWRVISGIMGMFFFAATYVQYNDPDPYIWMLVYVIPCIVSWAVAFGLTLKKYTRVPTTPETTTSSQADMDSAQLDTPRDSPVKRRLGPKKMTPVEADVIIPKYGSSNTKLNWLINVHIVYCFALGFWTLIVNLRNLNGTEGTERSKVKTARIFDRQLQMEAGTEEAKELMGLCLVIAWLSLLRHNNYVLLGTTGIVTAATLTFAPLVAWVCVEMFESETECV